MNWGICWNKKIKFINKRKQYWTMLTAPFMHKSWGILYLNSATDLFVAWFRFHGQTLKSAVVSTIPFCMTQNPWIKKLWNAVLFVVIRIFALQSTDINHNFIWPSTAAWCVQYIRFNWCTKALMWMTVPPVVSRGQVSVIRLAAWCNVGVDERKGWLRSVHLRATVPLKVDW